MGKCSGLKGGGHHRKALDVAERKRKEKEDRKKEQEYAGQRSIILQEILTKLDPNCDIYLDANDNKTNMSIPELCRSHFRYEDCSNRRCKFSHEHSIAEALGNVVSGSNVMNNDDGGCPTIPGLRLVAGILGDRGVASRRRRDQENRSRRKRTSLPDVDDGAIYSQSHGDSPFENALLEGSSFTNTIVTYLESDLDVLHLALSCRHFHNMVLIGDGNGEGCKDVQRRKHRAKERRLLERNRALLQSKAVAGRLRYAVSYVETNINANSHPKVKNKRKNKRNNSSSSSVGSLRPILVYDYENPHVFRAFRESGIKPNAESLPSTFSSNCKIVR
ncbi:unnamed protein product [Pseudo-nitzschia multistriata]|uniref:Uncharacterized protein n=1 Tax=Pseudo-nitzschia multistriata TaxID=183589 RepID=A0A448ZCF1_9STRA|nr:unnamed protein product [Pseudo-nitzschia multistriata]